MKQSLKTFLNATPLNTQGKKRHSVSQSEYNKFISNTITDLNKGYNVTIFSEEHLTVLLNHFGDKLVHRKSSEGKFYTLYLKEDN